MGKEKENTSEVIPIIILVISVIVFVSAVVTNINSGYGITKDCKPKSIGGYIMFPVRIGCEIGLRRWE